MNFDSPFRCLTMDEIDVIWFILFIHLFNPKAANFLFLRSFISRFINLLDIFVIEWLIKLVYSFLKTNEECSLSRQYLTFILRGVSFIPTCVFIFIYVSTMLNVFQSITNVKGAKSIFPFHNSFFFRFCMKNI